MTQRMQLLIISETPSFVNKLKKSDITRNHDVHYLAPREDVLAFLIENENHVVVIDLDFRKYKKKALDLLKKIKAFDALIDVLILGATAPEEDIVEWIGKGATDFFKEPIHPATLERIIENISRKRALRRDTLRLEQKLEKKYSFHGIIGKSPYMLEIFSLIQNIAQHFSSVLITGETGTGKELVARAIHKLGDPQRRKLIVCDCVAVPENLFESELFGYTKGAFTGADQDKKGLFETADNGIIFLDEIGEIPVSVQAKLLRVLEHRQFRPLGSNKTRSVNVRVIAATSKNLREGIKKGTFRQDLFYRLNKVEIFLHPLRKKPEDIPLLVRHFLNIKRKNLSKELNGISRQAQKLFQKYPWPGNVRELENVIESASILSKKNYIDILDLLKHLQEYYDSLDKIPFIEKEDLSTLEDLGKDYIIHILKLTENNLRKAAKILDISRTTPYSKLKKYGIRQ
ncbi:MAG: sigma-54-dependent Fis family transcriptional regulator [Candidatus Aminicenantes bacterium]|nr:MAG: sigma-54-dependent Fis family transcriptional regulator [Candidatus Aminicenantes bacterium]